MYIEDILNELVGFNSWKHGQATFLGQYEQELLISFFEQTQRNLGFTEKQCTSIFKILQHDKQRISVFIHKDIGPFLDNPQFRLPKRLLSNEKSIKVVSKNDREKVIKLKFPYDETLINTIKDFKKKQSLSRQLALGLYVHSSIDWNSETRTWDFAFHEDNIMWINQVVVSRGFEVDEEFSEYVKQIEKITESVEDFVPIVTFDGQFAFKNVHKNIPQPSTDQLLDVLIQAKRYAINTWDESIDIALKNSDLNPVTKAFIKHPDLSFTVNNKQFGFGDLTELSLKLGTLLFVIPGGSELEALRASHMFLKNAGVSNEEITVLFRLDSSAGKLCNEYVKENNLNNPISDKIRFIFISIKVPKPLMASKKKIDAIINLGSNSAHYTVKNLLKQHQCVINYSVPHSAKGKYLANL